MSQKNLKIWSNDKIADQLTDGFWKSIYSQSRSWDARVGDTVTYNISGLTSHNKKMARNAFDTWEDVSGLRFREVSKNADMMVDDRASGAYASAAVLSGEIIQAHINVGKNWSSDAYRYQTFIHEIGHALGLGHAGNYNGSARFSSSALYANDTWQASIMSYFRQSQSPHVEASNLFLETPMVADILAINDLYGMPKSGLRDGNTTYGDDRSAGEPWMALRDDRVQAIVDTGGRDTIDLESRSSNQRIDLNPEAFSDTGGRVGNLVIARGTTIENVRLGKGADTVVGNGADNHISVGSGNDRVMARSGDDTIRGGAGDDTIDGGPGNDVIDGGGGFDLVRLGSSGSYKVSLNGSALRLSSGGEVDVLRDVEKLGFSDGGFAVSDVVAALKRMDADGPVSMAAVIRQIESPSSVKAPKPAKAASTAKEVDASDAKGSKADSDSGSGKPAPAPAPAAPKPAKKPQPSDGPGNDDVRMEVGTVTIDRDPDDRGWVQVTFAHEIKNPIVVVGPVSSRDDDPVVAQVRGITSEGFKIRLEEFEYQDNARGMETVSWMAGTSGSHAMTDGTEVTFGLQKLNGLRDHKIDYDEAKTPIFLGTVTGVTDDARIAPILRTSDVTADGATVNMDMAEAERADGNGLSRWLHWATIEANAGKHVETGKLSVNHDAAKIGAKAGKALFAGMQTENGPDTVVVRADSSGNARTLVVQEEQSANRETNHAYETVAWASIKAGSYDLVARPGALRANTVDGEDAPASAVMEVGIATLDRGADDGWVRIDFTDAIADAVVVVGPVSANDDEPVLAQVRDVSETGFDLRLEEWSYQDGIHASETVTWVAGSRGEHVTTDGRTVAFGETEATVGAWSDLGAPDLGVVIGTVMGEDALTERFSDAEGAGMAVTLQASEAQAPTRVGDAATVAWMSVTEGDVIDVDHEAVSLNDAADALFAEMQSTVGGDTTTVRRTADADGGTALYLSEQTAQVGETPHAVEQVGVAAFATGWRALLTMEEAQAADPDALGYLGAGHYHGDGHDHGMPGEDFRWDDRGARGAERFAHDLGLACCCAGCIQSATADADMVEL